MGILRTDKISGLETPTAVTGSVEFDGSGDYLQTPDSEIFSMGTNDYTIEGWFYFTTLSSTQRLFGQRASDASELQMLLETNSSGELTYYFSISSSKNVGGVVATKVNTWHHIAVVRKDLVHTLYVDGVSVATNSTDTGSLDNQAQPFSIGRQGNYTSDAFNGHISNFRICKGTAVYTSNFTVPTHALEVTQDTVLLCCNNSDSVTASDHGRSGAAPPTLTANGDPAVSSINPGLTRDFTYGTEFKGVTTFDTQGYFVPPSGTTEQRDISLSTKPGGSGRAVSFGGEQSPLSPSVIKAIDTIVIPSLGDATDFGDLSQDNRKNTAASSSTRGLCVDGATPGATNVIEFITFAATGSSTNFGDTVQNVVQSGGASNGIRGVFAGGYNDADFMEYVTIATEGNAQDFGDLIQRRFDLAGLASPTRGIFAGGKFTPSPTINQMNSIEYITIASTGNAQDFGDMTFASRGPVGTSSQIRGVIGGGFTTSPSNASFNNIDFITIASTGNAFDFGDLRSARTETFGSTSNSLRAVFMGGDEAPGGSRVNTIDFVQIQTTGNAVDFGDLTTPKSGASACSDSHGGLS